MNKQEAIIKAKEINEIGGHIDWIIRYVAKDEDGVWYGYENKPDPIYADFHEDTGHWSSRKYWTDNKVFLGEDECWSESLTEIV